MQQVGGTYTRVTKPMWRGVPWNNALAVELLPFCLEEFATFVSPGMTRMIISLTWCFVRMIMMIWTNNKTTLTQLRECCFVVLQLDKFKAKGEENMHIAILGGTGFIGSALIKRFLAKGDRVVLFTRDPDRIKLGGNEALTVHKWPMEQPLTVDAVINLAGETINQRWTTEAKQRILLSRMEATQNVVKVIKQGQLCTGTLINGSAVGFYGNLPGPIFHEEDRPLRRDNDFLGQVTDTWEHQAEKVLELGVRLVKARFGVVLGREGGAFNKMVLPYRFFAGGRMGSGSQWVSWIHMADVVSLMDFCLRSDIKGAVNFTAPHPCTMDELGRTIAARLNRPHLLPIPALALKWMLGEMSDLILEGQKVVPQKSLHKGYSFQFETIDRAISELIRRDH